MIFFLFLQIDLIFKHAVKSNPVPPSDFWAPSQSPHLIAALGDVSEYAKFVI